jgi:predicted ribosome quality control (RQC) complex YloA/Tae2 family protein
MQTNDILERLDNKLDEVDSLIQELPIKAERKKQLASLVYQLWMEVEDDVALTPGDF